MQTRRVVLTDHQEALNRSLMASGRYHSADEILHDGLRMVGRREARDAAQQEALRLVAQVGRAALQNNGYADYTRPDCRIAQLRTPCETGSG